jgi:hypothetical protein
VYDRPGAYTATLSVEDDAGRSDIVDAEIPIDARA